MHTYVGLRAAEVHKCCWSWVVSSWFSVSLWGFGVHGAMVDGRMMCREQPSSPVKQPRQNLAGKACPELALLDVDALLDQLTHLF
jgi:hypothetical protein